MGMLIRLQAGFDPLEHLLIQCHDSYILALRSVAVGRLDITHFHYPHIRQNHQRILLLYSILQLMEGAHSKLKWQQRFTPD